MKGQLPVVSFRPEGQEHFMALMMHMVGTQVEVTYVEVVQHWGKDLGEEVKTSIELRTRRGEIVAMNDVGMALKPYGIPKRYSEGQYSNTEIAWSRVKMLEVIGAP